MKPELSTCGAPRTQLVAPPSSAEPAEASAYAKASADTLFAFIVRRQSPAMDGGVHG